MSLGNNRRGKATRRLGRRLLDARNRLEVFEERFQLLQAEGPKRFFPPAQDEFDADLVAFTEKPLCLRFSKLAVMRAHLEGNTDALHLDALLLLPVFALPLVVLILVLPEVKDPTDRRLCGGVHFHEVKLGDAGLPESLFSGDQADLFPVGADEANLPSAD